MSTIIESTKLTNGFVKINSKELGIKTTIKPYTNKQGKTHLAHFTYNGKYLGKCDLLGNEPIYYDGNFRTEEVERIKQQSTTTTPSITTTQQDTTTQQSTTTQSTTTQQDTITQLAQQIVSMCINNPNSEILLRTIANTLTTHTVTTN